MVYITIAFILGLLFFILTPLSFPVSVGIFSLFILFIFLCFIVRFTRNNFYDNSRLIFVLVGLILGAWIGIYQLKSYQSAIKLLPTEQSVTFKVIHINYENETSRVVLLESEAPLKYKTIRIYHDHHNLSLGKSYRARVKISPIRTKNLPSQFAYRLTLLSKKEIGTAKIIKNTLHEIPNINFIDNIRIKLSQYFFNHDFKHPELLSALSVGISDHISSKDWEILRRTGTIHLVSISGLHLTLIALWGFIIIRTIIGLCNIHSPSPNSIAAVISVLIALSYALIAGMSLPTQRALIMFTIAMIALLIRYPILSFSNLATAALITLIISPMAVMSIGFWLSFTTVLLLMIMSRFKLRPIPLIIVTQLMISIIVIPFTASFFSEISLISPFANFLAIPWTTVMILPLLMLGIILFPILPSLSESIFQVSDRMITILLDMLIVLNKTPYSFIHTPHIPILLAFGSTFLCLSFLSIKNHILKTLTLSIIAIIAIINSIPHTHSKVKLYGLPVGEGLSILITTPERHFLFDTGTYFKGHDSGKNVIIPVLNALNINKLDTIFISKENQQHMGGLSSVLAKYPDTLVALPEQLLSYREHNKNCKTYHIKDEHISISPITKIETCAFKLIINSHEIWLLGDISISEWNSLISTSDSPPSIILMPKQGRSKGYQIPKSFENVLIIFSTHHPHKSYQFPYINAADSFFEVTIEKALSIESASDQNRFWWMR